jgi:hypothetical protein
MKNWWVVLIISFFILQQRIYCQKCECEKIFNNLKSTIENNYVGVSLLNRIKDRERYKAFSKIILKKSQKASTNNCIIFLEQYLRFFDDNHLSIYQKVNNSNITIGKGLFEHSREVKKLAGLWKGKNAKKTILLKEKNGYLEGFLKNTDTTKKWKKFCVVYKEDNFYNFLFLNDESYRYSIRTVYKMGCIFYDNSLLYSRKIIKPALIEDSTLLKSQIMFRLLTKATAYLKFPSFDVQEKPMLDSLLKENDSIISHTKNLIIDLRNNFGGTITTGFGLIKYFYSNPFSFESAYYLSNDTIIKVLSQSVNFVKENLPDELESFKKLIETLKVKKGKVVHDTTITYNNLKILRYPEKIFLLINKNTSSSAELFTLAASKNSKVVIAGENSAGVVDFGAPQTFNLECDNFQLDIPQQMMDHTPKKRFENIGIKASIELKSRNPLKELLTLLQ